MRIAPFFMFVSILTLFLGHNVESEEMLTTLAIIGFGTICAAGGAALQHAIGVEE